MGRGQIWRKGLILGISILAGCLGSVTNVFAQHDETSNALHISEDDQRQILTEAGIIRIGHNYMIAGCGDALNVEFKVVDLNDDQTPDVILIVTGSPCFSGVMRSNVGVFVQSSFGRWRDTIGFQPAFGVSIQTEKTRGYANLVLRVLGGCDPFYRWTGTGYSYAGNLPADADSCNGRRE